MFDRRFTFQVGELTTVIVDDPPSTPLGPGDLFQIDTRIWKLEKDEAFVEEFKGWCEIWERIVCGFSSKTSFCCKFERRCCFGLDSGGVTDRGCL